jgi:hypothetical protein
MQKIVAKLYVIGARRGKFKNDDGEAIEYAAIFANDDVKPSEIQRGDAFGQCPQKIKADYKLLDQMRHQLDKLPAYCDFEASLDFNVTGDSKVKLLAFIGLSKADPVPLQRAK